MISVLPTKTILSRCCRRYRVSSAISRKNRSTGSRNVRISQPSKFYGVVTFYSQFHQNPRGKNIVTVCCGTVCHVKGAPRVIAKVRDDLKLKEDQDTHQGYDVYPGEGQLCGRLQYCPGCAD